MLGHADGVRLDELAGGQEHAAAAMRAGGDGRRSHARVGLARGAELGAGGEGKDVAGCVQAQRGDPAAAGEDLPAGAEAGVQGAVGVETSKRALNRREPDLALPGRAGHQDLSVTLNRDR